MDNYDLMRIKEEIKKKKKQNNKKNFKIPNFVNKFLLLVVITLIAMISIKTNSKFKTLFYQKVYDTNISFASINELYKQYFGAPIPFKDLIPKQNTAQVFKEKLEYSGANVHLDGVALNVNDNYLVPIQTSGLVVFIGEKEGYGNVVIIQQVNGIDLWYGGVSTTLKLYDYVEAGTLLGQCENNTLYLVYKKDGKVLDYHEYI